MRKTLASAGALLSVGALALTGCTPNNQNVASSASGAASSDGTINVTASDDACKLSATTAKAGTVTFKVKNEGTKVNEFYVLGADGLRIVSEVENIGPNLSRDLTVELPEGSYKTACKPGMVGDGIRGDFTVTKNENAAAISADEQALRDTAVTQYTAYVKDQVESLKTKTEQFAELYTAGKDDEAKALYSSARLHYERIEPVAESFGGGELDPALDAREADVEEGKEWTGWHKIEKDLWQPSGAGGRTAPDRSRTAGASPAAGAATATAAGAAAVTSKVSSKSFTKSESSMRDISLKASMSSSLESLAMIGILSILACYVSRLWM